MSNVRKICYVIIWNSKGEVVKTFEESADFVVCGNVWKNDLRHIVHYIFFCHGTTKLKITVSTYDSEWNLLERTEAGVLASFYGNIDGQTYAAQCKDNEMKILELVV